MRVLVLSCSTGGGHDAAGRAVQERVREQGHEAELVDLMLLAGRRASRIVGGGYVEIVRHVPQVFHAMYRVGDAISSPKRKSPVYYANALLARRLEEYLAQHPCDVIATPHLFAAESLTHLRKKGRLRQRVVAVSTDYTCIPFWEETDCDAYIIPHRDLAEEYIAKGVPEDRLYPFGIPVGLAFSRPADRAAARRACGLREEDPVFLVMSGSMGFGNIQAFAAALFRRLPKGAQTVMICGSNRKTFAMLSRKYGDDPDAHVVGYTDRVADYMDACDVIFTKPGGLTTTEAAVKNVPIVHISPIPGCELNNMQFFASRGMSSGVPDIPGQVEAGLLLARPGEARDRMLAAQRANVNAGASLDIFGLLREFSAAREGGASV